MCRGGSNGPLGRAHAFRALAVRLIAVAAALLIAAGGAVPGRALAGAADPGLVMVICSDGVAKTVVIDRDGNPAEPSDTGTCADPCVFCTAADTDALWSSAGTPGVWDAAMSAAAFQKTPATLSSERRCPTGARAPPFKKDA